MGKTTPLPVTVQSAAIRVCRDALHWRDDLRAVLVTAGVPVPLYEKYDHLGFSKAKLARAVFNELQERGEAGFIVQRKITQELCRMTKPHPDAPDQAAGKAALADLKHEATAVQILVDPEKAAADARRAASQRRVAAVQQRRERIGELRDTFIGLLQSKPVTNADRQERGYKLERLLADLFRAYDLEYRPSYKVAGEQIDGSFHFRGFTYIVEVKWRGDPPTSGDLLTFKAKVDGKMESTRGVFISMAGYGDDVLEHFVNTSRGSRNNVILFNGSDVTLLFEGSVGLEDALSAKVDAAEQEGRMWRSL
jgi:Restriction endonuclease